jgi:hypothetical protein
VFKNLKIPVNEIDLSDKRFRITHNTYDFELERSIRDVGLLNPPLLLKKERGFCMISGFKRIEVIKKLGIDIIDARITEIDDDLINTRIAVMDNSYQRVLSVTEQINAIKNLSRDYSNDETLDTLFSMVCVTLKIPSNKTYVKKLLAASQLSDELLLLISEERLNLDTAIEVGYFESNDQLKAAHFFSDFKMSFNKQKEFILLVREIAANEQKTLGSIFDDAFIQIQDFDESADKNVVFSVIRSYLKKRRYPMVMRFQEEHDNLVAQLKMPKGMTLKVPDYFEGSFSHIELDFKSWDDFKNLIEKLADISSKPEMKRIINREYACNNFEMR